MRLKDENKRKAIVQTAIKLFSEQPFEDVRLDDVAEAAGVGKGTVYIYFKNKEDLYYSLVYDGLAEAVSELQVQMSDGHLGFEQKIAAAIQAVVNYALRYPRLSDVLRKAAVPDANTPWDAKRRELSGLIENIIRQGVEAGVFIDPRPDLTSIYIPAMVRAVMMYSPADVQVEVLVQHMTHVVLRGIRKAGP